jgi:hypothetical protein
MKELKDCTMQLLHDERIKEFNCLSRHDERITELQNSIVPQDPTVPLLHDVKLGFSLAE